MFKRKVKVFGRSVPLAVIIAAVVGTAALALWLLLASFDTSFSALDWGVDITSVQVDDDGVVDGAWDAQDDGLNGDPSGIYLEVVPITPATRNAIGIGACTVSGSGPWNVSVTGGYPDYYCNIQFHAAAAVGTTETIVLQGWTIVDPAGDGISIVQSFPACGQGLNLGGENIGFHVTADDTLVPASVVGAMQIDFEFAPQVLYDPAACPP